MPGRLASPELARAMAELSAELKREISLVIDRRGRVLSVSVADAGAAALPETRAGERSLKGFHVLHTHPRGGALSKGDLSALFLNRLDAVAVIEMQNGQPSQLHAAHLTPVGSSAEEEDWRILPPVPWHRAEDFDLGAQVEALEEEFRRAGVAHEAKQRPERAILVQIDDGIPDAEERLAELKELARTAGAEVVHAEVVLRRNINPATLVGPGKLEELTSKAYHLDADLLIFGQEIGAAAARNIEQLTRLKIIDRSQLILDIFAQHAQGQESRLQVELAQLRYMKPRLLGAGAELSRIGASGGSAAGGAIGTRGPGETKLELDRRLINDRISFLEASLRDIGTRRGERRKTRSRKGVVTIGIVGYTNAGKSTLLNALTHAAEEPRRVLAENKLFATLRPTSRQSYLEGIGPVVLTDTVGFIRDLPKELVAAFKSTLEEIEDASLLLHVVDASSESALVQLESVERILGDFELDRAPMMVVLNKSDAAGEEKMRVLREHLGARGVPWATTSALKGLGVAELRQPLAGLILGHLAKEAEEAQEAKAERQRARWAAGLPSED